MKITRDAKKAADQICRKILSISKEKRYVVLGLPGGRSVRGIFNILREQPGLPWEKVHIFMVDERLVPIDDKESNFRLVVEQFAGMLVASGKMDASQLHPFRVDKTKKDFGIASYEKELMKYGGSYDIIILGVGEDGHVGGLFPEHTITDDSEFFLVFHDSPKPPKDRMTASRRLLMRAKMAILLFIGNGKRDAFICFKDKKTTIETCPAKLAECIEDAFVLTDIEQ